MDKMDKFVDDVFCELLEKKRLLDKNQISLLKERNRFVTLREKILLERLISVGDYREIALQIQTQKNRSLQDPTASWDYDDQFLQYGLQNRIISPKDIDYCKKLLPIIRIRELLLVENKISYETYGHIINILATDTAVQESFASLEQEDSSDQTLIDEVQQQVTSSSPILEKFPNSDNIVTTRQTLSIVKDPASQMILNIAEQDTPLSIPRPATTKPMTTPLKSSSIANNVMNHSTTTEKDQDDDMTLNTENNDMTLNIEEPEVPNSNVDDIVDASEDTLIDRPGIFSNQPEINVNIRSRDADIAQTNAQLNTPQAAETTEDGNNEYQPVAAAAETRTYSNITELNKRPGVSSAPSQVVNVLNEQDLAASQMLTSAVMGNLIKEVQNQVYLQTQQINQNVGKEISSYKSFYKVFAAIVIFFSLFLLAFTGWIEVQRFMEMKDLRVQIIRLTDRNEKLSQDKDELHKQIPQDILTLKTENAVLKERLQQGSDASLKTEITVLKERLQNVEQQKQELLNQQKRELDKQLQNKQQEVEQTFAEQKRALEAQISSLTQERDTIKKEKQKNDTEYTRIIRENKTIREAYQALLDMETYSIYKEILDNEHASKAWEQAIKNSIPVVEKNGGNELAALRFFYFTKKPLEWITAQADHSWLVAVKLGDYYEKQRKYSEARIFFTKALEQNSELKNIQTRLNRLPKQ